ncbi:MAG: hypothetical protein M3P27_03860 [Acidobacteriota bacterium]|nr:hypothetical protein [Acidobacteriota bacterium]
MRTKIAILLVAMAVVAVALAAGGSGPGSTGKTTKVTGYVLDSACAYTKNLDKPISADCAKKCAAAGSPLVILTKDGNVYLPIDGATPSSGQNAKLLPFAGQRVTATGTVYERAGSKAIVIEKIVAEKTSAAKTGAAK